MHEIAHHLDTRACKLPGYLFFWSGAFAGESDFQILVASRSVRWVYMMIASQD
jgi:hypothetical protein